MVGAKQARAELMTRRKSFVLDAWLIQKRALVTTLCPALASFSDKWDCCIPIAIVLGLKMIEFGRNTSDFRKYCKHSKIVKTDVVELMRQAGMIMGDLVNFTDALPKFSTTQMVNGTCINVFSVSHNMERIAHANINNEPAVNLLLYKEHCFLISSIVAMLGRNYCQMCNTRFHHAASLKTHRCSGAVCRLCKVVGCPGGPKRYTTPIRCESCQYGFFSAECITHHVSSDVCTQKGQCSVCSKFVPVKILNPPEAHHCMHHWCVVCKEWMDIGHMCYVRCENPNDEKLTKCRYKKILFYDVETCYYPGPRKNLRALCVYCTWDEPEMGEDQIFYMDKEPDGLCAMQKFIKYCATQSANGPILAKAHNGRRFDAYIVLWAAILLNLMPTFLAAGQSLLSVKFPQYKLTFVCTLSFITAPLRKFPQLFSLPSSLLDKSHAPFLYFKPEHLDVPLAGLPCKELFQISVMSPKETKEFDEWYISTSMGDF